MTVAQMPAGWYRDPSTRHEQRYWDGTQWSSQVLDHGITAQDPPTSLPGPAAATMGVGGGYRALSLGWPRYYAAALATFMLTLALVFELVSFVISFGTQFRASDDMLFMWSWLYKAADGLYGIQYVGRPPVLLLLALFVAPIALRTVYNINRGEALYKAGGRIARLWASPAEKAQWAFLQARLAEAGVARTSGARVRDVIGVIVSLVSSLVIVGLSALAINDHTANTVSGQIVANLSVGLGPWVCLIVGIAGAVGSLALLPVGRRIVIRADATVEEQPVAR